MYVKVAALLDGFAGNPGKNRVSLDCTNEGKFLQQVMSLRVPTLLQWQKTLCLDYLEAYWWSIVPFMLQGNLK